MTDEIDEERLHVHIPSDRKDWLDSQGRTNKDLVDDALALYQRVEGEASPATIKFDLEQVRQRRREAELEREELAERITTLEEQESKLEERLEAAREATETYAEALDDLIERVDTKGMHLFSENPKVREVAERHNITAADVVADARDRAPDSVPAEKFEPRPGLGSES